MLGLVVDHGDGGSPQSETARLAQALEIKRCVQLGCREQPHADSARHRGFGFSALPDSARMLIDQGAAGDSQGQLDTDLLVHVARNAVQLRSVALGCPDRFEPARAALDDVRNATQCLDIVDDRRLAKSPFDRRERRLDPGPAPLPFQAFDQSGLFAADVRPGAAVQPDVEIEARPVDIPAQVPGRPRLFDRRFEDLVRANILESQVQISRAWLGSRSRRSRIPSSS